MSGLDPGVEIADLKTLLAHAVRLLRLHVGDHEREPDCGWNDGEPCHNCRTVAFLDDNFSDENRVYPCVGRPGCASKMFVRDAVCAPCLGEVSP